MAHQFTRMFGPRQVADLRAGVDALQRSTCYRIPEPNAAVGSSSATRQESVLMGRPGDRLHGRHVFRIREHGLTASRIPDVQLVVIAAGSQMLMIRWPFQTTNLQQFQVQQSMSVNCMERMPKLDCSTTLSVISNQWNDLPNCEIILSVCEIEFNSVECSTLL